jgi:hypothetical protein
MNTLPHLFAEYRPVDMVILLVEFLVLLMIVWQMGARTLHKRTVAKRLMELFYAMAEGQELQAIAPHRTDERSASSGKWRQSVQEWITQTGKVLERCSAQAAISFIHNPDLTLTHPNGIAAPSEYESLVVRLNNLRGIIEHPDAYF